MTASSFDRRALSRRVSALENGEDWRFVPTSAECRVIGVTGPAGTGKSTMVGALVEQHRARGARVAALMVDPSDDVRGGALLGDRLRLNHHSTDPGVYLRSLSARGALGGLSTAVVPIVDLLERTGFGVVLLESVGVGQSERDIAHVADSVVYVGAGDMGDEVQFAKAGILEHADVVAVNKADLGGARSVAQQISRALARRPMSPTMWRTPVILTEAGAGRVDGLMSALDAHHAWLVAGNGVAAHRRRRLAYLLRAQLHAELDRVLESPELRECEREVLAELATGVGGVMDAHGSLWDAVRIHSGRCR